MVPEPWARASWVLLHRSARAAARGNAKAALGRKWNLRGSLCPECSAGRGKLLQSLLPYMVKNITWKQEKHGKQDEDVEKVPHIL